MRYTAQSGLLPLTKYNALITTDLVFLYESDF